MIQALWDFKYSWEIYTPAIKRKYGYYTLPILFGDHFIGRIEAIPDRKEGILHVKGLWWEPNRIRLRDHKRNCHKRTITDHLATFLTERHGINRSSNGQLLLTGSQLKKVKKKRRMKPNVSYAS